MSDAFSIEPLAAVISVDEGGPAAPVEVDVTNQLDRHVQAGVEVRAEEPMRPGWVTVEPSTFTLEANESQRLAMRVTPPADAPAGEHRFALRVYDVDRPADAFAEGPPIALSLGRDRAPDGAGGSRWLFAALGAALLVIVIAIAWVLLVPRGVAVPRLEGRDLRTAETVLNQAGLQLGRVVTEPSDRQQGTVIRHDPPRGDRVEEGTAVHVVVSDGDGEAPGAGPTTLQDIPPVPLSPPREGVVTFAPYSQHDMDPDCRVDEVSAGLVTGDGTVEVIEDGVDTNNLHVVVEYEVDIDFARVEITWVVDHPPGVACTLPSGR